MPGAGGYTVQFEAVDDAVLALAVATRNVERIVRTLEGRASSTLATWEDTAKQQYLIRKLEWDNAIALLNTLLGRASTTLNDINSGYRQVESVNAAYWDVG